MEYHLPLEKEHLAYNIDIFHLLSKELQQLHMGFVYKLVLLLRLVPGFYFLSLKFAFVPLKIILQPSQQLLRKPILLDDNATSLLNPGIIPKYRAQMVDRFQKYFHA
ncbi:hypothetical protein AXK33_02415 [Escherichia coli]|nr:hypothetical protein AWH70_11520 [Escherichia coli]OAF40102.1 hypothetical protein AXK33_02415 [Escherichia coli]OWC18051.1 hypothetical protein A8G06_05350 [Escherichia coli]